MQFSCVSWNVHRGRCNDGTVDPARTGRVLCDEVLATGPDALVLQEADEETPPHRGLLDLDRVSQVSGLVHVHGPPDRRWGSESHGFLGTVVFLHPEAEIEDVVLLDLPGVCHRGAVIVDFTRAGQPLRLIGTHLSLWQGLRAAQMRTIGQHLYRRATRPVVLCGDLNEWRPWGGLALWPRLVGVQLSGPAKPSFPVGRPFLPLDRVLTGFGAQVVQARVLDGPGIRAVSDHRPVAAWVAVSGGPDGEP